MLCNPCSTAQEEEEEEEEGVLWPQGCAWLLSLLAQSAQMGPIPTAFVWLLETENVLQRECGPKPGGIPSDCARLPLGHAVRGDVPGISLKNFLFLPAAQGQMEQEHSSGSCKGLVEFCGEGWAGAPRPAVLCPQPCHSLAGDTGHGHRVPSMVCSGQCCRRRMLRDGWGIFTRLCYSQGEWEGVKQLQSIVYSPSA